MTKYIGIPFKEHGRDAQEGFDCIGLVLHVLRDEYGEFVPDVWKYDTPESAQVCANFAVEVASAKTGESRWKECAPGAGAVVLFEVRGAIRHIGVMIDEKRFLHVMKNTLTCVETIDHPVWAKRIRGFYRWS